jgi:aryl carrier-like protein
MATRLSSVAQERLAAQGVAALAPQTALDALGELLEADATQAAVLSIDWSTMLAGGETPTLLVELSAGAATIDDGLRADVADVRTELDAAPVEERRAMLDGFVHLQITRVLGLDPAEPLDPWQGLTDIGMDSLMAVELSNRLRAGLHLSLPSTLAFEHPTFRALTEHLAVELWSAGDGQGAAAPADARRREADLEELARLSDDEVTDRLLRELDESGY